RSELLRLFHGPISLVSVALPNRETRQFSIQLIRPSQPMRLIDRPYRRFEMISSKSVQRKPSYLYARIDRPTMTSGCANSELLDGTSGYHNAQARKRECATRLSVDDIQSKKTAKLEKSAGRTADLCP